eukprot:6198959-Pleurochrysis_carterae.AAC.1
MTKTGFRLFVITYAALRGRRDIHIQDRRTVLGCHPMILPNSHWTWGELSLASKAIFAPDSEARLANKLVNTLKPRFWPLL